MNARRFRKLRKTDPALYAAGLAWLRAEGFAHVVKVKCHDDERVTVTQYLFDERGRHRVAREVNGRIVSVLTETITRIPRSRPPWLR